MASSDFEKAKSYFLEGVFHAENENWGQAEVSFKASHDILPGRASTVSNLLGVLVAQKKYDEAWLLVNDALTLGSESSKTNTNVGILHHKSQNFEEALIYLNKAINLDSTNFVAFLNKGKVLMEYNETSEALRYFDKTLELKPGNVDALMFKSFAYLVSGEHSLGWALYENRWKWLETANKRSYRQPYWLGNQDLAGKTIFLHWEQGLGDTIQFSRYASTFSKLGCRVALEVQKTLYPIMNKLTGVDHIVTAGHQPPKFDYHCSMMSLPFALRKITDTVPPPTTGLSVEDRKVSNWRARLGPKIGKRVGIVWSGNPNHPGDRNRSLRLSQFIKAIPDGCDVISLQKTILEDDRATFEKLNRVRHFGDDLTDFSDTAALCKLMDIIVSVDTSVAHLAGTLGIPVCVLLPYKPDFRWMLKRNDSPWYPSMTLYRQGSDRSWLPVLAAINSRLKSSE